MIILLTSGPANLDTICQAYVDKALSFVLTVTSITLLHSGKWGNGPLRLPIFQAGLHATSAFQLQCVCLCYGFLITLEPTWSFKHEKAVDSPSAHEVRHYQASAYEPSHAKVLILFWTRGPKIPVHCHRMNPVVHLGRSRSMPILSAKRFLALVPCVRANTAEVVPYKIT